MALVASAGGVGALARVLSALPPDLEAAVLVVLHLAPRHESVLAEVLGRSSSLPVKRAAAGERLDEGRVYVAPPDAHLTLGAGRRIALDASAPVHFLRPSGDVLLGSLAACEEVRALAVVLSGTGSDGAVGAAAVRAAGGRVVVQDEESAEYFGMPSAAIAAGAAHEVLPLAEIAEAVLRFVRP